MYSYPEFYQLYSELKTMFRERCNNSDPYYCQAWLNYYHTDEFVAWHRHTLSLHCGYHGFFCVDAEPSKTTYRLPDETEFDVVGKNNLLVLSENQGDFHRTWPWHLPEPRITIAFDIVPGARINPSDRLNHWLPIWYAPVTELEYVSLSKGEFWGFESLLGYHNKIVTVFKLNRK